MLVVGGFGEAMLWGALAGGLSVVVLAMLAPSRVCPQCSHKLPKLRKPDSWSQMLRGGWTCTECGTKCDRKGDTID